MTYGVKILLLVAGVTVLGMLGAEKIRAQPSPVSGILLEGRFMKKLTSSH